MITLAVIWIAWCVLHSLLISRSAHAVGKKTLGNRFYAYRFLYVCFSILSLIPVLWFQLTLPADQLLESRWTVLAGQAGLLFYAGWMFLGGARVYDMNFFLGLQQLRHQKNIQTGDLPFRSSGILALVRHPWYSGGIAFLWGVGPITDVYLVTRSILTCYFLVGTILEERRLHQDLGATYASYCRQVPMLIPWKLFLQKGNPPPG